MAEKSFAAKKIKLDGSGTPTIQSPGNLNLNAVTVGISTNLTVGGNMSVSGNQIDFTNLPTSNPGVAGRLWRNGTDVQISTG